MVGEVQFHGGDSYVQVNASGTLERLPQISAWAVLWLWFITRGGNMPLSWVREYVYRHAALREKRILRRLNRQRVGRSYRWRKP